MAIADAPSRFYMMGLVVLLSADVVPRIVFGNQSGVDALRRRHHPVRNRLRRSAYLSHKGRVGGRHRLVLPTAVLLGGLLVRVSDTLGRTVIAPAPLPAGLLTALVGASYFVSLLWRSRWAR